MRARRQHAHGIVEEFLCSTFFCSSGVELVVVNVVLIWQCIVRVLGVSRIFGAKIYKAIVFNAVRVPGRYVARKGCIVVLMWQRLYICWEL